LKWEGRCGRIRVTRNQLLQTVPELFCSESIPRFLLRISSIDITMFRIDSGSPARRSREVAKPLSFNAFDIRGWYDGELVTLITFGFLSPLTPIEESADEEYNEHD
jgi:hypothetical protein